MKLILDQASGMPELLELVSLQRVEAFAFFGMPIGDVAKTRRLANQDP